MATPNLNITLPVVGGDNDAWGTENNTAITRIDTFAGRNEYLSMAFNSPTVTSSATKVMMGLGSAWALTPNATGRVRLTINGITSNTGTSVLHNINVYYGTGTAPVNGAALTGTAILTGGDYGTISASGANTNTPISLTVEVSGLTLATAYWFDLALGVASGTGAIRVNSVIIEEIKFV